MRRATLCRDRVAPGQYGMTKTATEAELPTVLADSDDAAIVALLKTCAKTKNLSAGSTIHAHIRKRGIAERNIFVGNTLVDMYAKCGEVARARQVFEELPVRDVVSWTALIAGYTRQGQGDAALDCFDQMRREGLSPNAVTYACILKACASIGETQKGKEIHGEIVKEGLLAKHNVLGNALVDMYAKCGALAKAQEVFDQLSCRDVVSWTSLIAGYAQHGRGEEALNRFDMMRSTGLSPDAVTYSCILKACSSIGAISKGEEVHDDILRQGLLRNNSLLGNALVDMYVKCGELMKAQQAFSALPVRDIVSWTALIAGYAHHGYGEEALKQFEQMQREGHSPNEVTFSCILKACGTIKSSENGKEVHAEIVRAELLTHNSVLNTALVDMYVKCAELVKAREVLDGLLFRDVTSFNALIAGCCQQGHDREVIECFRRMQCEGLIKDGITLACTLKTCGSMGVTGRGKEIHVEIMEASLSGEDVVLRNALVDMYAKCGAIGTAIQVFQELNFHDIVSWNALVSGYCQHGDGSGAVGCFYQMQHQSFAPDEVTLSTVLKACGRIGSLGKGKEIHTRIVMEESASENSFLGNALVDMYAKCGDVTIAQCVFDGLSTRDIVSWNALITGYAQHGQSEKAIHCFEEMRRQGLLPDAVTFACILKSCGSLGALERGEEIHAHIMKEKSIGINSVLGNALVDMYAKCGALVKAQEIFDGLPLRDVVSWNALIAGYCQHGRSEETLKCFQQMQYESLSPDATTFGCILRACASIGAIDKGKEIHDHIISKKLLGEDTMLCNALIDMYAKCGELTKAQEVFDGLPAREVVSWTSLIAGYAQHGYSAEAINCFERMRGEGFGPDSVTFLCVLKACSSMGATDKGKRIHDEIVKEGLLVKDRQLSNALVDMYAKCGLITKAQEVFDELLIRDVVAWTALMAGYAQLGKYDIVFDLFNKMMSEGTDPDLAAFTVVLKACSSLGLVNQGEMYFEMINKQYDMTPTLEHHTCMVDLFGHAGNFEKAMAMIKKMPSSDYLPAWSSLLSACKKWGNVEIARIAFQNATRLDENPPPGYE